MTTDAFGWVALQIPDKILTTIGEVYYKTSH